MDGVVLGNGESRLFTADIYRPDDNSRVKTFLSKHYAHIEILVMKFRLGNSAVDSTMTKEVNRCLGAVIDMISTCSLVLEVELACGDSANSFSLQEDRLFDLDSEILKSFQDKAKSKFGKHCRVRVVKGGVELSQ
jgi:hypothetical protein